MIPETPPVRWATRTLGEVGQILKSRGGSKADEVQEGVPVIRYGELYTRHHDVIREFYSFVPEDKTGQYTPVQPGDILFASSGETLEEIGKSAVFPGPRKAFAGGDLLILRPGHEAEPMFLGYALNAPGVATQKSRLGQGSSVMHLYAHNLERIELLLPPLPEQKEIAAILSSVDDAIAATQKVIEQTEQVKKGLLQTLMTRGIGHTRFKKTEVGEIPEGWEVVDLQSLCTDDITYGVVKPGAEDPAGVMFIRSGDLRRGAIDLAGLRTITREVSRRYRRTLLRGGELLVGLVGQPGATALVPDALAGANIARQVALVRVDDRRCSREFVRLFLEGPVGQAGMGLTVIGSVQQVINLASLRRLKVPVPPRDEQKAIVSVVEGARSAAAQSEGRLNHLLTLKRGLLQDLLTGRVRVTPD